MDSVFLKRFSFLEKENWQRYRINFLIIDGDTLRNVDLTMKTSEKEKTTIYFNGMQTSDDISTSKLARKWKRYYKKMVFKELKTKLRN